MQQYLEYLCLNNVQLRGIIFRFQNKYSKNNAYSCVEYVLIFIFRGRVSFFLLEKSKKRQSQSSTRLKYTGDRGGAKLVLNKKNATCAYNLNSPLCPVLHIGTVVMQ